MIDQTVYLDPTFSNTSDFAEALAKLLESHDWERHSTPRVRRFDSKVVIEHAYGYLVFLKPGELALLDAVHTSSLKVVQRARCASM